ncbi:hypothetical protein C900_02941 [Fulvivirga imtechensis AK7]|uniref:DUF4440 domain-containing protein n=2 Tax=Fulvivirga TaxID=396811 RepID=L8JQU2_9BACT|nr:hypothetical protein C900_02941 [Fulvivirga imtechensis AK7]
MLSAVMPEVKSQSNMEKQNVENVVRRFIHGADARDIRQVDAVLNVNFRAVINRLFGGEDLSIMTKDLYLDLLKNGKIGGDQRQIEFLMTDIVGNYAVVKAKFKGKELLFTNYILLIRTIDNEWLMVTDLPHVEKP